MASAMHDFDHPGRTNAFLVGTKSPLVREGREIEKEEGGRERERGGSGEREREREERE